MKVKRNTLLLIACLVWSAAGINILRIGLIAYPPNLSIVNFLLSAVVFTVFQLRESRIDWCLRAGIGARRGACLRRSGCCLR